VPSSSYTPQLRPLSIGEVLDAGFRLLRHRFGTLMLSVLAVGVPLMVARTITLASTNPDWYDANAITYGDPPTEAVVGFWVAFAIVLLGAMLSMAVCFRVISAAYLGEPVKATRSIAAGLRRIPALLVAFVVLSVFFAFLFSLSVKIFITAPLWVFMAVKWSLTSPVIVAEKAGPFRAMRRSWQLTRDNWWRSFTVVLVTAIIMLVLFFAFVYAVDWVLFNNLDSISPIALATLDTAYFVVLLALLYPLCASILAVLYYDTRVRNEGFDLQLLAQSIGSGAPPSRFERSPERPEAAPTPAPAPVPAASASGGFAPPEGPASAS
jgi:hypothetical protein